MKGFLEKLFIFFLLVLAFEMKGCSLHVFYEKQKTTIH